MIKGYGILFRGMILLKRLLKRIEDASASPSEFTHIHYHSEMRVSRCKYCDVTDNDEYLIAQMSDDQEVFWICKNHNPFVSVELSVIDAYTGMIHTLPFCPLYEDRYVPGIKFVLDSFIGKGPKIAFFR